MYLFKCLHRTTLFITNTKCFLICSLNLSPNIYIFPLLMHYICTLLGSLKTQAVETQDIFVW